MPFGIRDLAGDTGIADDFAGLQLIFQLAGRHREAA